MEEPSKKSVWEKTSKQHVLRYAPSGTYYLRAKVGGQIVRESLRTKKFAVAKWQADERLRTLRGLSGGAKKGDDAPTTLGEALEIVHQQIESNPALKSGSRSAYSKAFASFKPGRGGVVPDTPLMRLSVREMELWWKKVGDTYSAARANFLLMLVRRAFKAARKCGVFVADPTEEMKRMKVPRTRLKLPSSSEFFSIVESIRKARPKNRAAADYIEFMAYSGMRPEEISHVEWEHVKEDVILVYGGPEGPKNHEPRQVPITPPMTDLLARMRDGSDCVGRLFGIRRPRASLSNACRRLGLPHQRIYDLRHLFATTCLESGVDVPTFAMWLGHKDGGALAMKTYVQNRTEHTARMAAKVTFGR